MFIREKTIKGKNYAYLVESRWKKGKVRQKVKKYLGRVHQLEKKKGEKKKKPGEAGKPGELIEKVSWKKSNNFQDLVRILVKRELQKHGFRENISKKGEKKKKRGQVWQGPENIICYYNKKVLRIKKGTRPVVLKINEGYLCEATISKLLNFQKRNEFSRERAIRLAKAFVEAGIKIPEQLFIQAYQIIEKR